MESATRRRRDELWVGLALLCLAASFLLYTRFVARPYRHDSRLLDRIIEHNQLLVAEGLALETKTDELQAEIDAKVFEIERLSTLLPPASPEAFIDEVQGWAEKEGLSVRVEKTPERGHVFYSEVGIRVRAGEAELEALRGSPDFTEWVGVYLDHLEEREARLLLLSFAEDSTRRTSWSMPAPCGGFESDVRLWPWTRRIEERRLALEQVCRELQRLEPIVRAKHELEERREELEGMIYILKDVRGTYEQFWPPPAPPPPPPP